MKNLEDQSKQLQKQFIFYMSILPTVNVARSIGGIEKPLVLSDAFNKLSDDEKMTRLGRVMRKLEQKLNRITRNRSLTRHSIKNNRRRTYSM